MGKLLYSTIAFMYVTVLSFGQTDSCYIYPHGDFIYLEQNDSNMVTYVIFNSKVKVIERGEKYYKVKYKDYTGWILKDIVLTVTDYNAMKFAEKKQMQKTEAERTKARNEFIYKRRTDLAKKYGSQEIAEKIMAKKIWLGMTDAMARESWGIPSHINRSVGSWGVNEQWVYKNTYLYFENGVLTSWQD